MIPVAIGTTMAVFIFKEKIETTALIVRPNGQRGMGSPSYRRRVMMLVDVAAALMIQVEISNSQKASIRPRSFLMVVFGVGHFASSGHWSLALDCS